ncbi:MAG: hypothetical protein A3F72_16610 [Bacteroidetes bacterium RIFCSPLOWO2_12_FULL_35_15]|nr:MAG: hypothetical protein A3F72_16610 [Bacteroidetes bacterium RIFCSPLOWO2_12_FULL_35_15]
MKNKNINLILFFLITYTSCNTPNKEKDEVYEIKNLYSDSLINIWNEKTIESFKKSNLINTNNYNLFNNYGTKERLVFMGFLCTQLEQNKFVRKVYVLEMEISGEVNTKINYLFFNGLTSDTVCIYKKTDHWALLKKEQFDITKLENFFEQNPTTQNCPEDKYKPNLNPSGIITLINKKNIESKVFIHFCDHHLEEFSSIVGNPR